MSSNVGSASLYEAGDQRNPPDSEKPENNAERYEEGKENSHNKDDPKDERSIAKRLDAAKAQNEGDDSGKDKTEEQIAGEEDPTLPARMHGNEPSKGAKIDKELMDEEAELIAKKDAAKAQSKAAKK